MKEDNKRYRLLKDLPDAKAGEIYVLRYKNGDTYVNEYTLNQKSPVIEHNSYFSWQVENNPEWFEEVKEAPLPEKIEVKIIGDGNESYSWRNKRCSN